jgi:hypothetical protein
MQPIFVAIANFWHMLFSFIQDPAAGFWSDLLNVRGIGNILKWFEETLGRGATL